MFVAVYGKVYLPYTANIFYFIRIIPLTLV